MILSPLNNHGLQLKNNGKKKKKKKGCAAIAAMK